MQNRRQNWVAGVVIVTAVLAALYLFRPPRTLIESSREYMRAATSGDWPAIVDSVTDNDLRDCRLTRQQWSNIVADVIVPITREWRVKRMITEVLANQKTMAIAYYQMVNANGKQVEFGMPAFATGERPITTISYWLSAAFILEGAARSQPDTSSRPDLVYRKVGYRALRTKLKALGFTGYMELDGKFVEAP